MAERFERLYKLSNDLYTSNSPIIISAGALLKDNSTGNLVVQIKFHSVSEKIIKAVKISISAFDISGSDLQGVTDYQYLDLHIFNGQEFGSNKAILLPSSVTRSFAISDITVIFSDGSQWKSIHPLSLSSLPSLKPLRTEFHNAEIEKQYKIDTNQLAQYIPCESIDLWSCACGEWNRSNHCTKCRLSKTNVFSALDISTLKSNADIRIAKEKEIREKEAEQQRINAEKEAVKKAEYDKKRKTIIKYSAIGIAAVITIIIVICIISSAIAKSRDLTLDKLLPLETREDVISLLGESKSTEVENSYDVTFMSDDYFVMFDYNDNNIDHYTLTYSFPGSKNIENALDLINYKPAYKDIATANKTFDKLLSAFKEELGTPDIFNSPVSTTTYTWTTDAREIELVNYIDNEELSVIGAIDIRVNCNLQSFCKHEDVKEEKADATCTKPGYKKSTCNICGYFDEVNQEALGHSYTSKITSKATCSKKGEQINTCSVCGHSETESLKPLSHKYVETVTKSATCLTAGEKCTKCSECGDIKSTETIPASGQHNYNLITSYEATCTEDGFIHRQCSDCDDSYDETLFANGHTSNSGWCSRCGYRVEQETDLYGNPISIGVSTSSVTVNGISTIYITTIGESSLTVNYDSAIVETEWGSWNGNTTSLTLIGVSEGYDLIELVGDDTGIFIYIDVYVE